MVLSNLNKLNDRKKSKRVGRGIGSGKGGHTVGKGQKGQKSRQGLRPRLGFEGGQSPLYKRLPKLGGFRNPSSKKYVTINLDALNKFKDGEEVTAEKLMEKKVIKSVPVGGVKVLSTGDIKKKVIIKGLTYSQKAKEKIESFGATINA